MSEQTQTSVGRKFIGGVLWNFLGQLGVAALSFFAVPYIVKGLSVELYGIYALIGVVCGYFSFLQLGLGSAAVKYIAEYDGKGDREKISASFWACGVSYFFLGMAGAAILIATARPIAVRLLHVAPPLVTPCVEAIRLGGIGFFVTMVSSAVCGAIIGAGRFDIVNRLGMLFSGLQLAAAIAVLKAGFSLNAVIISSIVVNSAAVFVYWRRAAGLFPSIRQFRFDPRMLARLLTFGGSFTVSSIAGPILLNADKLILTSLSTVAALTYYAVPFAVADKFSLVRSSFTTVLFPTFSALSDRRDGLDRQLHFVSTLSIFFVYGFLLFFFLFFGGQFFRIWIGADFERRSAPILLILVLAGMVGASAGPSLAALQGSGKPHLPALCHAVETALYLPVCYFLVRRYGALGAALAWTLRVGVDTLCLNYLYCREFSLSASGFYGRLAARVFLPLGGCCAGFWLLKAYVPGGVAPVACGTAGVFIMYCFLVWRYGIEAAHRQAVRQALREVLLAGNPVGTTA